MAVNKILQIYRVDEDPFQATSDHQIFTMLAKSEEEEEEVVVGEREEEGTAKSIIFFFILVVLMFTILGISICF